MKLLLISAHSPQARGGIAVWTDHFLSRCQLHDLECWLVNTKVEGKRAEKGTANRNFFDEIIRTRRIFGDLNRTLKEDAFDVAHLNTSCGTFGLFRDYLVAKKIMRKGIPVVTHYHCDIPYWIHNPISRNCLKQLAKISHRNLVLCENSRKYLQEQFGIEAVKIPNFIQDHVIIQTPKKINKHLQKVFFAGRISIAKGAKEAFALAKQFPEIIFEFAGDVSDETAAWEKPENVRLLGGMPHEQVIKHLGEADVFLFPSHSEGFSVALLESMARGVPAVATDVGAATDMLADGCGIVVEKENVEAMAMALRTLGKAETREEISRRAVNKCREQYTIDAVIDLIKKQYK